VPGTLGLKIGERRTPFFGSKSEDPEEMFCRKLVESGLYASVMKKRQHKFRYVSQRWKLEKIDMLRMAQVREKRECRHGRESRVGLLVWGLESFVV
jgi:hypothetical protein